MQSFPLKTACEEKARLLRRHAAAESDYYRAIHALSVAIGSRPPLRLGTVYVLS